MVGRAKPDMYSADLSLFVLDAGIALLERRDADLLYLSRRIMSNMRMRRAIPRPTPFTARSTTRWLDLSRSAPSSGSSPTMG